MVENLLGTLEIDLLGLVWSKRDIFGGFLASLGWLKVALGHFIEIFIFLFFVFDFEVDFFFLLVIYFDSCYVLKVSPWYAKFFYMGVWVDDIFFSILVKLILNWCLNFFTFLK